MKGLEKLILFVALCSSLTGNAQLEFPEDKVHWKFTVEQDGEDATVVGTITMEEHWHVYAAHLPEGSYLIPSTIKLESSNKFKLVGKITEPKPIFEHDELTGDDLYYHSNTVKLKQKIKVLSDKDFTIKGTFTFQTCDDTHCLPPHDAEFTVKVKGVEEEGDDEEESALEFVEENGDEAKDKEGNIYVKVDNEWYKVPEGNSVAFYKKYLTLGGQHEE